MKKPIFWIALVVASGATALFLVWLENALTGDLLVEVVPLVLGKATGLVLIPVVIAGVVMLFGKLFKRPASDATVFSVAAIVWIVLAASNITVTNYESSARSAGYVFAPKDCEYVVRFPDIPKLYSTDIENTAGKLVPLQGAQLAVGNGNAFLCAECGSHISSAQSRPSKEQMYSYMKIISSRLGLQLPAYEYRTNAYEAVGTITGTKDSERGSLTFRVINLVGNNSTMTLYIGSRSTDFMTPDMQHFVSSIKKSGEQ